MTFSCLNMSLGTPTNVEEVVSKVCIWSLITSNFNIKVNFTNLKNGMRCKLFDGNCFLTVARFAPTIMYNRFNKTVNKIQEEITYHLQEYAESIIYVPNTTISITQQNLQLRKHSYDLNQALDTNDSHEYKSRMVFAFGKKKFFVSFWPVSKKDI